MGYDVHITRASEWLDSELNPISLGEWLDYIDQDSEMRRDDVAIAQVDDGTVLAYENNGLAVWIKFSGHEVDGNMAWFDYRNGEIVVKNPGNEILAKMKHIANFFHANVIGDDGETY